MSTPLANYSLFGNSPAVDKARMRAELDARLRTRRAEIAKRIESLLKESPTSQKQIAAAVGKATSTLSGWSSGRAQPSLELLVELIKHTGRSADWILGLSEDRAPSTRAIEIALAEPSAAYALDPIDVRHAQMNTLVQELVDEVKASRRKR